MALPVLGSGKSESAIASTVPVPGTYIQCCGSHHFDADPDSTYHPDVDSDPVFYLMRIWIFNLCGSGSDFSP